MWNGILDLPWWGVVLAALGLTHITIASVTIFLHRCQAHRALDLGHGASHFFRFWLWLTTGIVTKQWAAVHRKHHAKCETAEDPHSPVAKGIKKVFWEGAELYRQACQSGEDMERYGKGTPDDWLERNVYAKHSMAGIVAMLGIDLLMFGAAGLTVWAVQMIWIPLFAAGVINGLGHYWGYRNFESPDASCNLSPWGILIGGEELHNNHHSYATSAKLSMRKGEFDIGWSYIRALEFIGQAKVRKVAQKARWKELPGLVEEERLLEVIAHRYDTLNRFGKAIKNTIEKELATLKREHPEFQGIPGLSAKNVRQWMLRDEKTLAPNEKAAFSMLLVSSQLLAKLYELRKALSDLWESSSATKEQLAQRFRSWLETAKKCEIEELRGFSVELGG